MILLTTPDDLGPCQVYCEQLKAEVRRLRVFEARWQQLTADLEDAQRQGYQVDALSFVRGVESREQVTP
jgi:hypothetical protein